MQPPERPARAGPREWIGLAVLTLPCLVYAMDLTVLNLAVPQLTRELRPDADELLWIVDVYGFLVAGSLVTMGTLGDRIGRRRLLLAGAAGFAVASVVAALATTAAQLVAARALLGLAGATLAPSTLSLIRSMFADAAQRQSAIAVWLSAFSAGTALGPVAGGLLLEHFHWGAVFLANVPVMALLLAVGPFLLPEYRDPAPGPLDLASAALSLLAVLAAIWALKQVAVEGLDPRSAAALAAAAVAGTAFLRRQRRLAHPFVDLALFRRPAFRAALGVNLLGAFLIAGLYLYIAQYLQLVLGLTPLAAALWSLPSAAAFVTGSLVVPAMAARLGARPLMTAGLLLASVGFGVLTAVRPGSSPVLLVTGMVVFSFGFTPVFALTTDLVVGAAPPERAGAAAALSETAFELGGALGIALLGSLGAALYRTRVEAALPTGLNASAAEAARATLGGALVAAGELPAAAGEALLAAARAAFTSGLTGSALFAVGVTLLLLPWVRRALRPERDPAAGPV